MASTTSLPPPLAEERRPPLFARLLAALVLLGVVLLPFAAIGVGLLLYFRGDSAMWAAPEGTRASYTPAPSAPDLQRVPVPDQGIPFTNTVRGSVYPLWEMSMSRQITDEGEPVWVDGNGARVRLPVLWSEDFWNPASGWVGGGSGGYAAGEYRVLEVASGAGAEVATHPREFKNVVARVDGRLERTTQGIALFLGFRFHQTARGSEGYVFSIAPDERTFRLELWQVEAGAQQRRALLDTTPSSAIRPGTAWNRLVVLADGPDLTLWINGLQVGRVRADRLYTGGMALGVSKQEGAAALATGDARFANLVVSSLE